VEVLWAQVRNLEFPKIYWVGKWLLPFMYSAPQDKKLVYVQYVSEVITRRLTVVYHYISQILNIPAFVLSFPVLKKLRIRSSGIWRRIAGKSFLELSKNIVVLLWRV